MGRKRKDGCSISSAAAVSIWSVGDDDDDYRNEMMKLTKVAKAWDFTCSFCFKKFPSAQALGGHQNAHRNERLEEKRLLVRDPVAYRKRAFLRSMKADQGSSSSTVDNHHHHMNHAEEEVKAACSIRFSSFGDSFDHNLDLTLKL